MRQKKSKKQSDKITLASVRIEMAKPRATRSARAAELNLNANRIAELPSANFQGTVLKIIPARRPGGKPETVQIALDVPEKENRELRIENALTDEHGKDVRLRKGAQVDVRITAKDRASTVDLDAPVSPSLSGNSG
jgi:hypothetical protein